MRTLSVLLLLSACLILFGCKHDLSKIEPAADSPGFSGEGAGGKSGSEGKSGEGGESGSEGNGGESGESGEGGEGGRSGSEGGSGVPRCPVPGRTVDCVCPDGKTGIQECLPDGDWSACQCPVNGGEGGFGGFSGLGGIGGYGGIVPAPLMCQSDCIGDDSTTLCMELCHLFCEGQERYCEYSRCPPRNVFCAPDGEGTAVCLENCSNDEVCARSTCEETKGLTCTSFGEFCRDGDPICDPGGTCRDTCFYFDDGECDDGGVNALTHLCGWGTDCTDCGTRYEEPAYCSTIGCECTDHGECCRNFDERAFCVDRGDGVGICMMSCTSMGSMECEPGFVCVPIDAGAYFACAPL